MSFEFRNLRNLGNHISVEPLKDEEGYVGRECPEKTCEGYFKIKPGTGLTGKSLPCYCPYCGHLGPTDHFWTKEQVEYARSVALRKINDAVVADLKTLEFETKPKGLFGIGISVKVQPGAPEPIRHYREKKLETQVTCDACTLQYAVYGVFAFCPDCGAHNSLQILERNLELARRQAVLGSAQTDEQFRRYLIEDALENCVSAFDGFGRECCRIRAAKSTDPRQSEKLSFQNLPRAAMHLQALFAIDLEAATGPKDWNAANKYLDETGDTSSALGRRLLVTPIDVEQLAEAVARVGRTLLHLLPPAR